MDKLKINLFGMFEARAQGVPLRLPTRRVELILALLALSPDKAISRSYLATLLWPEQEAAQARGSLRQALFRLRGALGADHEAALEATTGWVKLRREAITLDTDAMAEDNASSDAVPDGIPLDGLSGFEPEIEELIDTARADLRRQLCAWHAAAATRAEAEHRYVDLEGHARRQLALEPYDEAALRDLMNALWRQGRRNSALSVFRQTSRRIREDLSVSVETETSSLYAEIRGSGELRDEDETQSDQAAMREELKTAEIEPAVLAESGTSPSTTENNEDGPVHLRHLAVIHVRSERLRIALRDPDPESADAASRRAVHDISLVVDREGGEIIGHAGHQLSAVFGARRPDESPALSAALAGFEIAGLDCAVGIHAGASLVGTQSGTFPLVLLAQALSAAAVAGEVRITAEVEASCHGAFEFAEADAVPGEDGTKGAATWRIRREKSARSGFDIRKARGLSNFCGRKEELTVLADVATMGGSRVAVIIGAAGIGKSRLAHEFLNHHEPQTLLRVQFARSGPGGGLSCFAGMLRFLLDIDPERKSPPLSELLPPDLFPPEISGKIAPALGSILGQADQERSWLDLSRGHRFQALADVLLTVMEAFAGSNCVLLVEDAHWADEEAELLLERLVLSLGVASPMLIITRRPGKAESWLGQEHVKALTLRPLAMDDAAGLLETLDLPSSTQATILERSEGVPLFLEELLRAAVSDKTLLNTAEDVTDRLSHIPVGLRGILSFRIDALPGPARRVLEAAAVLGAEPSDDLLTALSSLKGDAYELALSTLSDADLLYRIRRFPRRSYAFKHALIQDAAYQGIPASRRSNLHAQVVAIHIDTGPYDGLGEAVLAHHAIHGDLLDQAIDFAMRAAKDAAARSAYALAKHMTDVALKAIASSPSTDELLRLEADILIWRRALLWPLAEKAQMLAGLERAEEIARQLKDDRRLADVSIHRAYIHSDDGNPLLGLSFFEQARSAAIRAGDDRLVAECSLACCQILSLQGKMKAARDAIRTHVHDWDDRRFARDGLLVTRYVMLHFHLARIEAVIGDGDQAFSSLQKATVTACETARPVDRYVACRAIAEVCAITGAVALAQKAFSLTHEIALKAELPAYAAWSEAELAELALDTEDALTAGETLRRLLEIGGHGLLRIAQIKARAALACACDASEPGSLDFLREVMAEADAVDLPMSRIKLLNEMAARLAKQDPEEAATLKESAEKIVSDEGYAPVKPAYPAEIERLLTLLRNSDTC